jgi:D-alanyl-D-alanine carboxypeptidase
MKDSQTQKRKLRKFLKKKPNIKSLIARKTNSSEKEPHAGSKHPSIASRIGTAFNNYANDILLLFIPVGLFFIFVILILLNNHFLKKIYATQVPIYIEVNKINPYPYVGEMPLLPLSAKAAIVLDSDSQVAIFSKNPNLLFPMASTAKIMTALTAFDYYKYNSVLTIKSSFTEGSILGLQVGDTFYFEDLLYAMLLPSANDAAVAIADNYFAGREAFIAKMNERAQLLNLVSTRFSDPTGLDDDHNYTNVTDMARLASIAIKNEKFAQVTGTKQRIITNTLGTKQYVLTNLNKLLGINGVTGIKTGTTEGAREVLVTSVERDDHTFIIVVMNSEDRFGDTQTLLNFVDQSVQFVAPVLK